MIIAPPSSGVPAGSALSPDSSNNAPRHLGLGCTFQPDEAAGNSPLSLGAFELIWRAS